MRPYAVFGEELIDRGAFEQMDEVAKMEPYVKGALMPDAHVGYSMPIGGVAGFENAISPALVGLDIGCQVNLSVFEGVSVEGLNLDSMIEPLRLSTSFGIGAKSNWPKDQKHTAHIMYSPAWDDFKPLKDLKEKAWSQLGTSGGGNHFADLVVVSLYQKRVLGLLTHSGSRGTGKLLVDHYDKLARDICVTMHKPGYSWLRADSEAGREYIAAMQTMIEYATASHELIHECFARLAGIEATLHYRSIHNTATLDDGLWVHRKGAIDASPGRMGLIPSSSGSISRVVSGLGNPDALNSAPHGAGRSMSRKKAKELISEEDVKAHMQLYGIRSNGLSKDESIFAYKDGDAVMDATEKNRLALQVTTLTPIYVMMGGKSDDGD